VLLLPCPGCSPADDAPARSRRAEEGWPAIRPCATRPREAIAACVARLSDPGAARRAQEAQEASRPRLASCAASIRNFRELAPGAGRGALGGGGGGRRRRRRPPALTPPTPRLTNAASRSTCWAIRRKSTACRWSSGSADVKACWLRSRSYPAGSLVELAEHLGSAGRQHALRSRVDLRRVLEPEVDAARGSRFIRFVDERYQWTRRARGLPPSRRRSRWQHGALRPRCAAAEALGTAATAADRPVHRQLHAERAALARARRPPASRTAGWQQGDLAAAEATLTRVPLMADEEIALALMRLQAEPVGSSCGRSIGTPQAKAPRRQLTRARWRSGPPRRRTRAPAAPHANPVAGILRVVPRGLVGEQAQHSAGRRLIATVAKRDASRLTMVDARPGGGRPILSWSYWPPGWPSSGRSPGIPTPHARSGRASAMSAGVVWCGNVGGIAGLIMAGSGEMDVKHR
jgi:hypothetical protein